MEEQKRYKAASYAIFAVAIGLLISRISASFVRTALLNMDSLSVIGKSFALDIIFSILTQIVFCFLIPFLIYKNYQKIPAKQVFIDSHYKKTKWWIIALCPLIAFFEYFFSVLLNLLFVMILLVAGYQPSNSPSVLPQTFGFGFLLLSLFLTAVLPALCEEFAIRGTFLRSMRSTYANGALIFVMAISFGLFHQNIMQLFFTAVFGGFMAYLVIKTDSIWPAVVIHFCSNGIAVLLEYSQFYNWGGGFYDKIIDLLVGDGNLIGIIFKMALLLGAIVGLCVPIVKYSQKNKIEKPVKRFYKPTVRESAFFIGAIVATVLTTIITFMFGY